MEDRLAEQSTGFTSTVLLVLLWCGGTMALWFFAFYNAPETTPEWLLRAQSACFGRTETGLPDVQGWLLLVLAPLLLLVSVGIAFSDELRRDVVLLSQRNSGRVFLSLLVFVGVVEALWVTGRIQAGRAIADANFSAVEQGELPAGYPELDQETQPFVLLNQRREKVALESLRGRVVVLTFAFSHCLTVCPAVIQSVRAAMKKLPRDKTELVIVSLDPWRDTPTVLEGFAKNWSLEKNEHILSGSVLEVLSVIKQFNIPTVRDEQTGDITHPPVVYVIDQFGKIAYAFSNPSPTWLSQGASRLLEKGAAL